MSTFKDKLGGHPLPTQVSLVISLKQDGILGYDEARKLLNIEDEDCCTNDCGEGCDYGDDEDPAKYTTPQLDIIVLSAKKMKKELKRVAKRIKKSQEEW